MKNIIKVTILCLAIALIGACGGGGTTPADTDDDGGGSSSVTLTFLPADDATDQAANVDVTVTFSAAITEPADQTAWLAAFSLKAAGGDNLCTAIDYDTSTFVATCHHTVLSGETAYTIAVTGLTDADSKTIGDASAAFTTTGAVSVASYTKTTVTETNEGEGSMSITYTFNDDIPSDVTPSVAVTVLDQSFDCTPSPEDGKVCTVEIEGLGDCQDLQDYTATISGTGIASYDVTFNSSDDEFDNTNSYSCYNASGFLEGCLKTYSNGIFSFTAPVGTDCALYKTYEPGESGFAVTLGTAVFDSDETGNGNRTESTGLVNDDDSSNSIHMLYGWFNSLNGKEWAWVYAGEELYVALAKTNSTVDGSTVKYKCFVFYGDTITSYISDGGEVFTKLSISNAQDPGLEGLSYPDSLDVPADWTTVKSDFGIKNEATDAGTLTGSFDFMRYRSSGITGTEADCLTK